MSLDDGDRRAAPQRHLTELTLEFLATLELERGLSRNTLEAYRSDLQQYGAFLGARGIDPLEVKPVDLLEFISELATGRDGKAPVGAATLQRKIACLRSFYRHLRREQIIDHDPTAELRGRASRPSGCRRSSAATRSTACSPSRRAPRPPRCAIARCSRRCTPADCGRRRRSRSSSSDLDLEAGVLRARGKGSKERLVPIGSKAIETLRGLSRARAARGWSGCATSRACSSTCAAAGSPARGCTRSSRATPAAPGSSTG